MDWEWLATQPVVEETRFLRHIRLAAPAEVRLDGRTRRGAIFKPNGRSEPRP
ncbi:MAG: hypothetical protein V2A79_11230 [Planctomycetota bacterium]